MAPEIALALYGRVLLTVLILGVTIETVYGGGGAR